MFQSYIKQLSSFPRPSNRVEDNIFHLAQDLARVKHYHLQNTTIAKLITVTQSKWGLVVYELKMEIVCCLMCVLSMFF